MIKNLSHAFMGLLLILGVGYLLDQPAFAKPMAGHKDARYAVLGLLAVLSLFVLVSLVRALRPPKKKAGHAAGPYATTTRRR